MGTPLREAIDLIGNGMLEGRQVIAIQCGVSAGVLPGDKLDTPLTFEAMAEAGGGLGSAGFTILDETCDVVAVVAGASRFLAIESCGQCEPCKQDGLALAQELDKLCQNAAGDVELKQIAGLVGTVANEARSPWRASTKPSSAACSTVSRPQSTPTSVAPPRRSSRTRRRHARYRGRHRRRQHRPRTQAARTGPTTRRTPASSPSTSTNDSRGHAVPVWYGMSSGRSGRRRVVGVGGEPVAPGAHGFFVLLVDELVDRALEPLPRRRGQVVALLEVQPLWASSTASRVTLPVWSWPGWRPIIRYV